MEVVDDLSHVECDVCTGTVFKAAKSCLVCQASYCSEHLEPHLRVPALRRHKLIEPVDNIEERVCADHDKALDLYCRDEEVCICAVCIETDHLGHDVVFLEEHGVHMKEKIESQIAQVKVMIEERVNKIQLFMDSSVKRDEVAQKEIQNMDEIVKTFTKHMEEALTKVKTSINEKLQTYKDRDEEVIEDLQEEITDLQLMQSKLEELMDSDDPLHLLQTLEMVGSPSEMKDWTKTMVYSDVGLETVRLAVSELLDTFQDTLKTLTKKEIGQMKQYKESLTFDPATAGRRLVVYDSGKRIKHHRNRPHSVMDSPARFHFPMVFSTQGFTGGRHYWEVLIGSKSRWDVGVAKESVPRKGEVSVEAKDGFYAIDREDLFPKCLPNNKVIHLVPTPVTIGIFLDYEEGRVSFYDINRQVHVCCFREKFTEKLFPYFYLYSKSKKSHPMELLSMQEWRPFFNLCNLAKKDETEKQRSSSGATEAAGSSQPETMSQ